MAGADQRLGQPWSCEDHGSLSRSRLQRRISLIGASLLVTEPRRDGTIEQTCPHGGAEPSARPIGSPFCQRARRLRGVERAARDDHERLMIGWNFSMRRAGRVTSTGDSSAAESQHRRR